MFCKNTKHLSVVLLCFHASASEYLEGPSEYDLRVGSECEIMDHIMLYNLSTGS